MWGLARRGTKVMPELGQAPGDTVAFVRFTNAFTSSTVPPRRGGSRGGPRGCGRKWSQKGSRENGTLALLKANPESEKGLVKRRELAALEFETAKKKASLLKSYVPLES